MTNKKISIHCPIHGKQITIDIRVENNPAVQCIKCYLAGKRWDKRRQALERSKKVIHR
jgi:Zn ribbon nucleic-acid-binding protein